LLRRRNTRIAKLDLGEVGSSPLGFGCRAQLAFLGVEHRHLPQRRSLLSSLNTRLTTFGLADIRGGMGLGFDEGSWLTTVFGAAQMVAAPSAAWLSTVIGTRRFLLWASVIFALTSLMIPFTRDYDTIIALQSLRGLAVGAFIPASLGFILRSLTPQWWIWGLAAYASRFVFSQNIAGSLEAFYSESGAWQWIFLQNAVLAPVMTALVWYAMPREPIDLTLLRQTDWRGLALVGVGLGLIYAGIDQGNRLDWLNSGVVSGLFAGGGLLVIAFIATELTTEYPLIHLRVVANRNVWVSAVLISIYGFGVMATAFVLPDYLTRVQGLRELQIGDVLNWIALPQFVFVPLAAVLLRRIDARLLVAIGFALIAYASWPNTGLTHDWAGDDFLPSQIAGAVGLALGITALVVFGVANITPAEAPTIAVVIQIGRLFGNEVGTAFVQTCVRVREQVYSNLTGLHFIAGSHRSDTAVATATALFAARPIGAGDPTMQGLAGIGGLIRREAYVLAYIDGFWIIAWVMTGGIILLLLLRPPPNPLTPPRSDRAEPSTKI
jgi:MFS transporter, DHA2 family, multidrug resistance protein